MLSIRISVACIRVAVLVIDTHDWCFCRTPSGRVE